MLNQAEINFYHGNSGNVIAHRKRGHIEVICWWDARNKCYVVDRKTPKTKWSDRFFPYHHDNPNECKGYEDAQRRANKRFWEFYSMTNKQLDNQLVK